MTGFNSKREAAADKLQEPVCDKDPRGCWNVRCQLGKQCKNLAQPEQEPWNEDEWRRNNWRCSHGWLRGEQCEICNAEQEPPSEWAGIKAILDEYGLQAIDFVADFKAVLAQPVQDPVAWYHDDFGTLELSRIQRVGWKPLYTAPPQREWVGLTDEDIHNTVGYDETREMYKFALALIAKLKERNHGT